MYVYIYIYIYILYIYTYIALVGRESYRDVASLLPEARSKEAAGNRGRLESDDPEKTSANHPEVCFTILYYTILYYTTLHYNTLHYTTLHYTTL